MTNGRVSAWADNGLNFKTAVPHKEGKEYISIYSFPPSCVLYRADVPE